MVWEPGSEVVGDFTWPGFDSEVVVTERVFDSMRQRFTGFEAGPVELVEDKGIRGRPRIRLPYLGPSLLEIWATRWVDIDLGVSSVTLAASCQTCGRARYELAGAEQWLASYDRNRRKLVRTHSPRQPGKGVYVRIADLDGAGIFRINEFPSWVFCSDSVREHIQAQGFTNVSFLEIGEGLS